mmetsp:Transcript_80303/g.240567  ORF Transcript_80303/g.240567 Transcript_80303/m.240567 type:complete len:279 (-) Transcript_80303:314-1150(-)
MGKELGDLAPHLGGSGAAAIINFPLWKAAAIGQSGFQEAAGTWMGRMKLVFGPPYKGVAATIFGMTWARAAIFYFSDHGKEALLRGGFSSALATTLPPVVVSVIVQLVNQPIVRGTIMLQDPSSTQPNVVSQLVVLWRQRGWQGLWHGSTVSVFKTVPKYATAIWVKDIVQAALPPPTAPEGAPGHHTQVLCRSAAKSVAAGVAGAALTNPLDVIRNEMFKTEEGLVATTKRLWKLEGAGFMSRGMQRNLVAVAAPIGMTIFLTDTIIEYTRHPSKKR